jgi:carboxymethylenebutenolidase
MILTVTTLAGQRECRSQAGVPGYEVVSGQGDGLLSSAPGPFTFRTAASKPKRVGAFASLHGGGLATDAANSPHLLFADMEASMLIAIAQNDDQREPNVKNVLKEAAAQAGLDAEIEVYPAQHGWCAIDSTAYDEAQAAKAYDRMVALFGRAL